MGEGQETEPNYFRGLRDEPIVREGYAITIKGAHGFSQDAVVKETIKHKGRNDYDEYGASSMSRVHPSAFVFSSFLPALSLSLSPVRSARFS